MTWELAGTIAGIIFPIIGVFLEVIRRWLKVARENFDNKIETLQNDVEHLKEITEELEKDVTHIKVTGLEKFATKAEFDKFVDKASLNVRELFLQQKETGEKVAKMEGKSE
jgi:uncharacterized protein YoxC